MAAAAAGGSAPTPAPEHGLTAREVDVLARIAKGASNKLIARALDLSSHTVKRHVANILGKPDLGSRAQASAWWQARLAPAAPAAAATAAATAAGIGRATGATGTPDLPR